MILLLTTTAALASCGDDLPPAPASQSVVWVSPLGKRVGIHKLVRVVPLAALKAFAQNHELDTARMLQLLGLRRSHKAPKRPWKVTVFEASSGALCRPIGPDTGSDTLAGLPICEAVFQADSTETGCGRTRDRKTGDQGLELHRARWRDLAPQGFCVFPADRFAAEL